jgi:chromate transporter
VTADRAPEMPTFREALLYWAKLGFISFGGPAGQIALMHRELVEKRRWIGEVHFLHALNFCMMLPGPEAQQLVIYLGWRLHGAKGGIAAGALFVLPSVLVLFGLSWVYMEAGRAPWLAGLFYGLFPVVIALVASALGRIGHKALRTPALWATAVISFAAIRFFHISFVWIIMGAAVGGWAGHALLPGQFPAGKGHAGGAADGEYDVLELPLCPRATWRRSLAVLWIGGLLWWLPILAAGAWLGWNSTAFAQGMFFSKAALVTFGGAYAVLPYVAQMAVERYGWLSHGQMMAGLGLAESTPGPLIMVLQFVGFVGGWQHPGNLSPLAGATVGAVVTTWATFLPCFLFVFLGGPHVEQLRDRPALASAMGAVTAAVVGVILNLGLTFASHALWSDGAAGTDWFVGVVAVAAYVAMERYRVGVLAVIGAGGSLGCLWKMGWLVLR